MKTKYFWITKDGPKASYEAWAVEPIWRENWERVDGWYDEDNSVNARIFKMCPVGFEKATGLHLEGGPRSITKRRLAL